MERDYILIDTGMNYAMVERYGGVPTAGVLIDKPISGTYKDDIKLLSGGECPLGRSRMSVGDAYLASKKQVVATFLGGKCLGVEASHLEELEEYASL